MFYEKGAEWGDDPPGPSEWMHQLKGSSWASQAHYYTGEDLVYALDRTIVKNIYL